MKNTITVTTKGTFTMPASIRKRLGVSTKGDKLAYTYDEKNERLIIEKPKDGFETLNKDLAVYVNLKQPLINVSEHYQNRKPRI